jgi:hypothetical protein
MISMTELMFMLRRASDDFLRRADQTTRRAGHAVEAPRPHELAPKRQVDGISRCRSAVANWRDVAAAWLIMMTATAALLGW